MCATASTRPAPDASNVDKARREGWYKDFDEINTLARQILEKYSGIPPNDVVSHVKDIQARAIQVFPYPCVGLLSFLEIVISKYPCYYEVKERLSAGEIFLDVGCGFGQELRQLILDGVPTRNLYASDLDDGFFSKGLELFRDKGKLESAFIAADILDPGSALNQLTGQVGVINAGLFFHLFPWDQQVQVAKRLVGLFNPAASGLLTGRHIAGSSFREASGAWGTAYMHSAESWKTLWEEVGEATGTKWDVSITQEPMKEQMKPLLGADGYTMQFVVRRIKE